MRVDSSSEQDDAVAAHEEAEEQAEVREVDQDGSEGAEPVV